MMEFQLSNLSPLWLEARRNIIDWLWPDLCAHCRAELPPELPACGGAMLCAGCLPRLKRAEPPFCLRCAVPVPPARVLCPACARGEPACRFIRAAYRYRGPAVSLVHAFKYRFRRRAAQAAGAWMARALKGLPELSACEALVPVPLHPSRLRERGYNQARLLAEAIAGETGLPVADILSRQRPTAPQARLGRPARRENARGAFAAQASARGRRLLLVDDVCTTGATLEECARALRRAGARDVRGFVFARD